MSGGFEMIKAIVYKSNTGFTKKYAELLSTETSLPHYSIEESDKHLQKDDKIIFLGCIMAGSIKGLRKAKQRYNIRAAAGVGMTEPSAEYLATLRKTNRLESMPCFYLRGGFDIDKLHGLSRLILSAANSAAAKKNGGNNTELNRADYVSSENLCELMDWYRRNN